MENYSYEIQKLFLSIIISSPTLYTRCQNILESKYWANDLRNSASFIFEYIQKYNKLPTPELIYGQTNNQIDKLSDSDIASMSDWFLETIESFCRHKAMEILIKDAVETLLDKNQYGEIEKRCKEAMMISLQKDLGTSYFGNPLERLEKMKEKMDMTSSGWKSIDEKLYGGFNRGELTVWAAGSGVGKSVILQNQAINWVNQGLNVLYITLELSEELCGLRTDAIVTEETTKFIFGHMDEIAKRLLFIKRNSPVDKGEYQIKKFPEAGTTVNDIRAYIKEYEIQTGKKFDALCVDYLDILYPISNKVDINSAFLKDKMVAEELRRLAGDLGVFCASASQLNRSSIEEGDFNQSHIAGGISKINTADNVIAIFAPPAMKEQGRFQVQFLKTRSSNGVGQRVDLKYNNECMRLSDLNEYENVDNNIEVIKENMKKEELPKQQPVNNAKAMSRLQKLKERNK